MAEHLCGAQVSLEGGRWYIEYPNSKDEAQSLLEAAYKIALHKYLETSHWGDKRQVIGLQAAMGRIDPQLNLFSATAAMLRLIEVSALYRYKINKLSSTEVEVEFKSYRISLWGPAWTEVPTYVYGFPTEDYLQERGYQFLVRPGVFSLSRILPKSKSVKVWWKVVPDLGTELRELSLDRDLLTTGVHEKNQGITLTW
jgi:hypothetical protein